MAVTPEFAKEILVNPWVEDERDVGPGQGCVLECPQNDGQVVSEKTNG